MQEQGAAPPGRGARYPQQLWRPEWAAAAAVGFQPSPSGGLATHRPPQLNTTNSTNQHQQHQLADAGATTQAGGYQRMPSAPGASPRRQQHARSARAAWAPAELGTERAAEQQQLWPAAPLGSLGSTAAAVPGGVPPAHSRAPPAMAGPGGPSHVGGGQGRGTRAASSSRPGTAAGAAKRKLDTPCRNVADDPLRPMPGWLPGAGSSSAWGSCFRPPPLEVSEVSGLLPLTLDAPRDPAVSPYQHQPPQPFEHACTERASRRSESISSTSAFLPAGTAGRRPATAAGDSSAPSRLVIRPLRGSTLGGPPGSPGLEARFNSLTTLDLPTGQPGNFARHSTPSAHTLHTLALGALGPLTDLDAFGAPGRAWQQHRTSDGGVGAVPTPSLQSRWAWPCNAPAGGTEALRGCCTLPTATPGDVLDGMHWLDHIMFPDLGAEQQQRPQRQTSTPPLPGGADVLTAEQHLHQPAAKLSRTSWDGRGWQSAPLPVPQVPLRAQSWRGREGDGEGWQPGGVREDVAAPATALCSPAGAACGPGLRPQQLPSPGHEQQPHLHLRPGGPFQHLQQQQQQQRQQHLQPHHPQQPCPVLHEEEPEARSNDARHLFLLFQHDGPQDDAQQQLGHGHGHSLSAGPSLGLGFSLSLNNGLGYAHAHGDEQRHGAGSADIAVDAFDAADALMMELLSDCEDELPNPAGGGHTRQLDAGEETSEMEAMLLPVLSLPGGTPAGLFGLSGQSPGAPSTAAEAVNWEGDGASAAAAAANGSRPSSSRSGMPALAVALGGLSTWHQSSCSPSQPEPPPHLRTPAAAAAAAGSSHSGGALALADHILPGGGELGYRSSGAVPLPLQEAAVVAPEESGDPEGGTSEFQVSGPDGSSESFSSQGTNEASGPLETVSQPRSTSQDTGKAVSAAEPRRFRTAAYTWGASRSTAGIAFEAAAGPRSATGRLGALSSDGQGPAAAGGPRSPPPTPNRANREGSKSRTYNRTVPSFADVVRHALFQPGRYMWSVGNTKDGVEVEVTESGDIIYCGAGFPSISAFALVVLRLRNEKRQACDGWKEVRYNGVKMEVLRKQCLQRMLELGEV